MYNDHSKFYYSLITKFNLGVKMKGDKQFPQTILEKIIDNINVDLLKESDFDNEVVTDITQQLRSSKITPDEIINILRSEK